MALLLHIETSTKNCSVALAKDGTLVALKELNDGNYSHAEKLHVFIEEVLKESKQSFSALDAIAVSKGPGSYTGLRIGVSAAKGLCFALDIPLISIDTLQSLALQANQTNGITVPMLDARRMEVYSAVFNAFNERIRQTKAEVIDENSFIEYLNEGDVYFIGDGVEKTAQVIQHKNANYIEQKLPSANEMISLAYQKYTNDDFEDTAYFEPYYLKDFMVTQKKK